MSRLFFVFVLILFSNIVFGQSSGYNELIWIDSLASGITQPFIGTLNDSNFCLTWVTWVDIMGVRSQVFNHNGAKSGSEILVSIENNYLASSPCIVGLNNGDYVISWTCKRTNELEEEIFAQLFDSENNRIGNEFQINKYNLQAQQKSVLCSTLTGGFISAWQSTGQDGSSSGIYSQIFNENGNKIGDEFRINSHTSSAQNTPSISSLSGERFIVCWDSYGQDGSGTGVYAQIFNLDGEKIGNEFMVNTRTNENQMNAVVHQLSNNGFVICWQSYKHDGYGWGIAAQMYDEYAEKVGNEFLVNSSFLGSQMYPQIVSFNDGGFVIIWRSDFNGLKIIAQVFNAKGEKIGHEFLVDSSTVGIQNEASICKVNNDKFIVCWKNENRKENSFSILAKFFLENPINHILSRFDIINPEYDATLQQTNPAFSWNKASQIRINFPWELTYDLYIANDESFSNPLVITGIEDTTYQIDTLAAGHTYFAKVLARNYYGDSLWSSNITGFYIDPNATGIKDIKKLPNEFKLEQNYPNPFNPTTVITYEIPEQTFVNLKVYNLLGQEVAELVNEVKSVGEHKCEFNARSLSSGIYFYRINTQNFSSTKKMILLR